MKTLEEEKVGTWKKEREGGRKIKAMKGRNSKQLKLSLSFNYREMAIQ
jgi:hypothetical protein